METENGEKGELEGGCLFVFKANMGVRAVHRLRPTWGLRPCSCFTRKKPLCLWVDMFCHPGEVQGQLY